MCDTSGKFSFPFHSLSNFKMENIVTTRREQEQTTDLSVLLHSLPEIGWRAWKSLRDISVGSANPQFNWIKLCVCAIVRRLNEKPSYHPNPRSRCKNTTKSKRTHTHTHTIPVSYRTKRKTNILLRDFKRQPNEFRTVRAMEFWMAFVMISNGRRAKANE